MNDQQLLRYSRHLLLPQIDVQGQQKLLNSHALVIGLGGLGSPVSMYLAASGVGHLSLADGDAVSLSNLQRQIVHRSAAIEQQKVASASETLQALNSDVRLTSYPQYLSGDALTAAVTQADVVLDCSDNLATRLEVNQVCYQTGTVLVSAAAIGGEGQLLVVDGGHGSACYRCLYDENADVNLTCATSGVLAPLVGVMGSMQALEAIKALLGMTQAGKLQIYDAWRGSWQTLSLPKQPHCPICASAQ